MKMNAPRKSALLVIIPMVALGALGVGVVAGRHRHQDAVVSADPSEGAARETEPPAASTPAPVRAPEPVPAAQPVMAKGPPPAAGPAATESELMAAIRNLGASDPARALELARDGNRRFPKSADAAERSWTICKSLAALGRSSEAQVEARLLVHQYPDTTWANDVTRHLLTQPLADPAQRGYGKSSELD
jgi:TolA-binding protein